MIISRCAAGAEPVPAVPARRSWLQYRKTALSRQARIFSFKICALRSVQLKSGSCTDGFSEVPTNTDLAGTVLPSPAPLRGSQLASFERPSNAGIPGFLPFAGRFSNAVSNTFKRRPDAVQTSCLIRPKPDIVLKPLPSPTQPTESYYAILFARLSHHIQSDPMKSRSA